MVQQLFKTPASFQLAVVQFTAEMYWWLKLLVNRVQVAFTLKHICFAYIIFHMIKKVFCHIHTCLDNPENVLVVEAIS